MAALPIVTDSKRKKGKRRLYRGEETGAGPDSAGILFVD